MAQVIDIADLDLLRTLPERTTLAAADLELIQRIRRDALLDRTRIAVLKNEVTLLQRRVLKSEILL